MPVQGDDDADESAGLIDLDMGQFGQGTMNDPLRHAMGMRSAQDACKMRNWNSWPTLFQNTIFHGEQDSSIKELRHDRPLCERLARAKELKATGNASLKAFTASEPAASSQDPRKPVEPSQEELALSEQIQELEHEISETEKKLRDLKKQRAVLKENRERLEHERIGNIHQPAPFGMEQDAGNTKQLEDAITSYEKAAGILRFVECFRPDWKNDDGSYKGIEDEWLKVDTSALDGDGPEAEEAKDLVTSCYMNIALASQKLGKFDDMKRACDEVLDNVNATCVKALYRRAQSRIAPQNAVDADMDAALQDLHAAAQLSPQDKDVRGLLTKLRAERKAQRSDNRSTFGGFFERGEVVTNDPRTEGDKAAKIDPSKLDIRDPKVQRMLDIRPGPNDY